MFEKTFSVGSKDEQVTMLVFGHIQDLFYRITHAHGQVAHILQAAGILIGHLAEAVPVVCYLPYRLLVFLFFPHFLDLRAEGGVSRFDHVDDDDFRVEPAGELNRVVEGVE